MDSSEIAVLKFHERNLAFILDSIQKEAAQSKRREKQN
jgi:hypothetical protein